MRPAVCIRAPSRIWKLAARSRETLPKLSRRSRETLPKLSRRECADPRVGVARRPAREFAAECCDAAVWALCVADGREGDSDMEVSIRAWNDILRSETA